MLAMVGAFNIEEFASTLNSYLYIKDKNEIKFVAKKMMFLTKTAIAYDEAFQWASFPCNV
jgi:hypothetical protein